MDWLEDYEAFRASGKLPVDSDLMNLLDRRLAWEIWSEYTFDCRIGRTLEKTGSSTLEVKPDIWKRVLEILLPRLQEHIGPLRELDKSTLQGFLAGLIQNLKNRGRLMKLTWRHISRALEPTGRSGSRMAARYGGQMSRGCREPLSS